MAGGNIRTPLRAARPRAQALTAFVNAQLWVWAVPPLMRVYNRHLFKPASGFNLGRASIPCALIGAAYCLFSVSTVALPNTLPTTRRGGGVAPATVAARAGGGAAGAFLAAALHITASSLTCPRRPPHRLPSTQPEFELRSGHLRRGHPLLRGDLPDRGAVARHLHRPAADERGAEPAAWGVRQGVPGLQGRARLRAAAGGRHRARRRRRCRRPRWCDEVGSC